jgi:hypothetical protein
VFFVRWELNSYGLLYLEPDRASRCYNIVTCMGCVNIDGVWIG